MSDENKNITANLQNTESILDRMMGSDKQKFTPVEIESYVDEFLSKVLSEREYEIVKIRFGLNRKKQTLEDVGKRFEITRERVRQIVNIAVKKVEKSIKKESSIYKLDILVRDILESRGGIVCLECLLEDLVDSDSKEYNNNFLNYLFFFLNHISIFANSTDYSEPHWVLYDEVNKFQKEIEEMAVSVLKNKEKPISIKSLYCELEKNPHMHEWKNKVVSILNFVDIDSLNWFEVLRSYLSVSDIISYNKLGGWGMKDMPLIMLTRVADRAYLVLDYYKKPMHFKDICEYIIKFELSDRKMNILTVHNELIMDDRFVLVGRGIYALKEWGYEEGTVSDVISNILKKEGRPMDKEEIIDMVLKKRMVKRETIVLALSNKDKFKKTESGYYTLNE